MTTEQSRKSEHQLESLNGIWHNQNNSEIESNVSADGMLSGTFTTSANGCSPETHSLTGFASGRVVAFSVQFPLHKCVTSWVGHYSEDGAIECLWNMALDVDNDQPLWKSTLSGADRFVAGPCKYSLQSSRTAPASHPLWLTPQS
jgi:hypothetical protein